MGRQKAQGNVDELMRQALLLSRQGDLRRAEQLYRKALAVAPDHAEANHMAGLIAYQAGHPEKAVRFIRKALRARPDFVAAHANLGNVLLETNRPEEAESCFRAALRYQPDLAEVCANLGSALHAQGRSAEAIPELRRALALKPTLTQARYNLGRVLLAQGHSRDAVSELREVLQQAPQSAEALAALGGACREAGEVSESLQLLEQAVAMEPGSAAAWFSLANSRSAAGLVVPALDAYCEAWQRAPHRPEIFQNAALLLHGRALQLDDAGDRYDTFLIAALERDDLETQDLSLAVASLLLDPANTATVDAALSCPEAEWGLEDVIGDAVLMSLLTRPLLHALLKRTILTDLTLERVLTRVRRSWLESMTGAEMPHPSLAAFHGLTYACARQCFWNEYVWSVAPAELELLSGLRERAPMVALEDSTQGGLLLAFLGCYQPLSELCLEEKAIRRLSGSRDSNLQALIRLQVQEPAQERQLAASTPRLGEIRDEVSQEVRRQYEQNPYPRWLGIYRGHPLPFPAHLNQEVAPNSVADATFPAAPRVLVAGCGTGRQPISLAALYQHCSVLAVDLSLASLGYAQRKAIEYGLKNVEFKQADILALVELDEEFDVVACDGVLHHLREPMAGWRSLTGLLRPGGYMKVGLYSELARRHVIAARELIDENGFDATPSGIRACREYLMSLSDEHPAKALLRDRDFFATSTLRDLIFHVQEHRFRLPQIATAIAELGLEFLGMVCDAPLKRRYLEFNPADEQALSLEGWDRFEQAYPDSFGGMYQFWLHKVCEQ